MKTLSWLSCLLIVAAASSSSAQIVIIDDTDASIIEATDGSTLETITDPNDPTNEVGLFSVDGTIDFVGANAGSFPLTANQLGQEFTFSFDVGFPADTVLVNIPDDPATPEVETQFASVFAQIDFGNPDVLVDDGFGGMVPLNQNLGFLAGFFAPNVDPSLNDGTLGTISFTGTIPTELDINPSPLIFDGVPNAEITPLIVLTTNSFSGVPEGTAGPALLLDNFRLEIVPEPSSVALLCLGAVGALVRRR